MTEAYQMTTALEKVSADPVHAFVYLSALVKQCGTKEAEAALKCLWDRADAHVQRTRRQRQRRRKAAKRLAERAAAQGVGP